MKCALQFSRMTASQPTLTKSSLVTLREITRDSVRDFCRMEVGPGQDGRVASNAVSVVQAYFHKARVVPRYLRRRHPGGLCHAGRLLLPFVPKDNKPEIFYRRFGFVRTGEEDAGGFVMKLRLGYKPKFSP